MNKSRSLLASLFLTIFSGSGINGEIIKTDILETMLTGDLLNTIFLRFYTGGDMETYVDQKLPNAREFVSKMERNKRTVLYIHGFSESVESNSVATVLQGYFKRKDHNVMAVDYRNISHRSYLAAAKAAGDVGIALAESLNGMVEEGLDPEKLHIVGHSLGAQVSGYVGRNTAFEVPRITGLDPAGPLFYLVEKHLSTTDAGFVDIIHTDYGVYGSATISGSVDFYPNGGHRIQPGCPPRPIFYSTEDFCSHHRSWMFYAESLSNENAFLSIRCKSFLQFAFGGCNRDKKIPMGYATPPTVKGRYYLVTNAESPFGLGEEGTKFYPLKKILP